MRGRYSLSMAALVMVAATPALAGQDDPTYAFETTTIDYGTIAHQSDGRRSFKLKNIGTAPLMILDVVSSCGCVVAQFDREPVFPGQTVDIRVRYDTARMGPFTKHVVVKTSGTPAEYRLTIRGTVQ
ncbi:MAG: DUF1573 domain-containing protein [Pseudomonadota bacterium]